jgi:AcrR family transcriptional regulator
MVRPRAENYEEKRQSILDGAAAMFAERGFDGTSIAAIAQYCGVSKALLYHYYQSKEALLFDMLHSHCTLLVETAKGSIEKNHEPERQLQSLIRSLMALYVSSRDKHVVLLNSLHCLPQDQQKQIKDQEKRVLQVIKDLLAKLRPGLDAPTKTSLAMYLMGAINWTYTWFKAQGAVSAQEFADLATTIFLSGIHGRLPES